MPVSRRPVGSRRHPPVSCTTIIRSRVRRTGGTRRSDAAFERRAEDSGRSSALWLRCTRPGHGERGAWALADERKATLIKFDEATREYAELNALLGGGILEDLETQTSNHERQAAELAAEFAPLSEIGVDVDLDQDVRAAETLAHDSAHKATGAETLARERAREVPSVPEAEEALDSAKQEFERVTRLSRTLALTLEFLGKAEERVHRDIAPLLAAGLRRWLSDVTQGRYTDARVDPSDLSVQVLGPENEWRDARQLSHGTAEQIYLLLRVVLAERLATTGETCPLILDDVLVQSDRARKRSLLEAIASISRGRQVILLTQEEEVLRWAQENVVAPNRVLELASPLTGRTTI